MTDINIDFHATPDELCDWVREWSNFGEIHLVVMRFPPISFEEISVDKIPDVFADSAVRRISFLLQPFDPSIKYQSDFDDEYNHQLVLEVGRSTPDGLGESWIACRTDNAEALNLWRRIANDLKARTDYGLTAINRQTGETGFYKKHRYSQGAKALDDKGVPILSIVGPGKGPILRLGRVTQH
jgi:hypothetical protein